MENATKALVIAATVLISVMVASIIVYLFVQYSQFVYDHDQREIKKQLQQYNAKFEKYIDKDLSLQDVVTIANMAHEYNLKYGPDSGYGSIVVEFNGGGFSGSNNIANGTGWSNINDKLNKIYDTSAANDEQKYYIQGPILNENDGIVSKIIIKKKT